VPANFLEELAAEWFEYRGYFVRRNIKVGKREKGGFECELDVVAFHPATKHLVHIEPSTDASKWEKREERYKKKFEAGRKYIPAMFPGLLKPGAVPEQIALLVAASRTQQRQLAGGKVIHVSVFLREILDHFKGFAMVSAQVPEGFPLLRTLQFVAEYRKQLFLEGATQTSDGSVFPASATH
jgi:hypothetical protein